MNNFPMKLSTCPISKVITSINFPDGLEPYDVKPTTFARIRTDLLEDELMPPAMDVITGDEFDLRPFKDKHFMCAQPDELAYEEWNAMLHIEGQLIAVNSIDFDFEPLSQACKLASNDAIVEPVKKVSMGIANTTANTQAHLNFLSAVINPTAKPC